MNLDDLAKLEQAATKGWKYTLEGDIRNDADGLVADFVPFSGDGNLASAARNALPALIRVAKLAQEIVCEVRDRNPTKIAMIAALRELDEVKQ